MPVAFLRLWMVYATCSFSPAQRLGISNLEELSKVKLNKEEQLRLISSWENEKKKIVTLIHRAIPMPPLVF